MSEITKVFLEENHRPITLKCDGCGLEQSIEQTGNGYIVGGLVVVVGGGWQSAKPGPDVRMDLCDLCAQKLIALFPVISQERALQYTHRRLQKIL